MKTPLAQTPPTLAAPSGRALLHGFLATVRPSAYAGEVERQLAAAFPPTRPMPFATGRAALAAAIGVAMRATGRSGVVLPAFTSFSVAAAAATAGARVRLCDMEANTLDFARGDLRSCVDSDTAAVVLGNLYGYPSSDRDLSWLRERGVLVIDDAAQAIGAVDQGRSVGWRGELGVLSFGRGKCVTTGDGGVLLVHDRGLEPLVAELRTAPARRGVREWLAAMAVRACAHPMAFALLSRVPGGRIGESVYDPEFELRRESASVHGLAVDLAQAIDRQLASRTRVARIWFNALRASREVTVVAPREEARPAYLRFPVFASGPSARRRLVAELARRGLRFVISYPTALGGVSEFNRRHCEDRPTPGAERMANTVIVLPCHEAVEVEDVRRAAAVLRHEQGWGQGTPSGEGSPRPSALFEV